MYFQITQVQPGRFKFVEGFEWQGNISWAGLMVNRSDGIYLTPLNGKLRGTFVSPNFRATHGYDTTYTITLRPQPDGQLVYSVTSQLAPEKWYATRIDGEPTQSESSAMLSDVQVVTGIVIDILRPAAGTQIKLDANGKCFQFGLGTDYGANRLSRSRALAWDRVVNTLKNRRSRFAGI